jgi:branched-chain amino acid transport system substrate-binding protein
MEEERSDKPTFYPEPESLKRMAAGNSGQEGSSRPPRALSRREVVLGGAAGATGLAVGLGGGIGLGFALDKGEAEVSTAGEVTGPPIKFGNSVPLTGFASGDGQDMMRGYRMAVDVVNERGGIAGRPIQLVTLDGGEFAPDVMVNNFKRFVTESKVDALVGGYQTNAGPEIDVAADAGVPYYHNSTLQVVAQKVGKDPERYWNIFQHDPTEVWYSRSLPEVLNGLEAGGDWKPFNSDVALINANNTYSAGLTKEFKKVIKERKEKWNVTLVEEVTVPNTEWGATLAKIRENPPGVIWMTDYFPGDEASFMKQFVSDPTPSLIHMQYGPSVPEFLELAQEAGNGVMWASVIALVQDDIGKAWVREYERRFKAKPGFSQGGATYDSTLLWATAAAMAGGAGDHRKVAEVTKKLIFRGVVGSRYFEPFADNTDRPYPTFWKDSALGMPTEYFQIQDGEHVAIFPEPFTTGEFRPPPWLERAA